MLVLLCTITFIQNSSYIYLVCGNTMCVSTCQVEFVLRELSFFILLPWSRLFECSEDFSVLKRTVLLVINYYPGGWNHVHDLNSFFNSVCCCFLMQVTRHTRPEANFKVWATIYFFFQGPLTPTPRAGTGLPHLQSIGLCIMDQKPGWQNRKHYLPKPNQTSKNQR